MVTNGVSAASRFAADLIDLRDPRALIQSPAEISVGLFRFALMLKGSSDQRAELIERSTASLGQQSSFSPTDF